jgi:hypothetical protein
VGEGAALQVDKRSLESASTRMTEMLRQHLSPEDAAVVIACDGTIVIVPPSRGSDRVLEVRIRGAADLEVAFIVPTKPGSPFEQVFAGPAGEADAVVHEVVAFVCDLISERMVLAWDRRPLRGGRRFLEASDLTPAALRDLAWVVSWRGIRDWNKPAT